jgi:hypothetical protein
MYILDYKINKQLYQLRDEITSEFLTYLESMYNKVTDNKRKLAKKAVGCFILNTYNNCMNNHDKVGVTLDESVYTKPFIVNGKSTGRKVSYTYTRSLLDFLVIKGYITLDIGSTPEYGFHMGKWQIISFVRSFIVFKDKLKTLYCNHPLNGDNVKTLTNVIILRNRNKESLTFKMNVHIKEVKDYLQKFNEFSKEKVVKSGDKVYDVQSYKVFNENFQRGGRTHMKNSVQGLSKQQRHSITIDNENICAYDFKGFEPSLAYSMSQENMEFTDPYELDLDGYDSEVLRKFSKLALLIMFNTESKELAHKALNSAVRAEFDVDKLCTDGKIPDSRIPVKMLMEMLEDKHHLISDKFYRGFGAELQYAGSLINDYVVESMMQNYGCLVIQTHDEFIAPAKFRKELLDCMKKAYEHVCGFSINCRIVREA